MKRFVLLGCFVVLSIAPPFATSLLSVPREAGIEELDSIPTLEHDWTVGDQPGLMIGLVGYPGSTYVCYGPGYFWIPVPAAFLASLIVFGFTGVVYLFVCCLPRSR